MKKRLPALCLPMLLSGCQGSSCIDGADLTRLFVVVGGVFLIVIIGAMVIHND